MFGQLGNIIVNNLLTFDLNNLIDLDSYIENLHLGYKDKVIILFGETGVGKSTFINCITKNPKACEVSSKSTSTTKKLQFVKLFQDVFNYYFIDTPGLNDSEGDSKHIELLQKISKKGIINSFILVRNYSIIKLNNSFKNTIKTLMEVFPSENFFKHMILLETFYSEDLEVQKDSFITSITENQELNELIIDNNIIIPKEIKTFCINLKKANDNIFNEILSIIKDMFPLYKKYEETNDFTITEIYFNSEKCLQYLYNKKIKYTDFNDIEHEKTELIENGIFPIKQLNPFQVIVEREKTNETRNKYWILCCFPENHIKYWEVKQYYINGHPFELKNLHLETWEDDDKEGEKLRKKIESQLNRNYHIKNN